MAEESLKNKTVKGVGWSFADSILGQGITFVVGLVLARLLSPEEYGLIGICLIFTTILSSMSGRLYDHYRIVLIPLFVIPMALLFNLLVSMYKKFKRKAIVNMIIALLVGLIGYIGCINIFIPFREKIAEDQDYKKSGTLERVISVIVDNTNEEDKISEDKKEEVKKMDIYTEEELREIEAEESETNEDTYEDDDDVDYDEFDEYYDEEK